MRIEQLQYLIEIADTGSISAAAEKLHISQPNISKALSIMEEELNTAIFKRTRAGVKPTETGQLIIDQAREILLQISHLKKIGQSRSSSLAGSLSFAAIPSFNASFLPSALGEFTKRHPKVQTEIIGAGSLRIKEYVLDGKIDFGLMAFFENAEIDEKLVFEPLVFGQCMVCVGKHSPLASKKQITLQELIGYPIVTFSEEYGMNVFVLNFLKNYGKPKLLIASGNAEGSKKFISQGVAVGFFGDIALKTDPYVLSGEIVPIYISNPQTYSHFGIVYRKDANLSVPSVEFIKELKIQAKEFCRMYNLSEPEAT